MVVRYEDQEELVEAGADSMARDHTIAVDAGTVLIEFSPKDKFQETVAVDERKRAKLADSSLMERITTERVET